MSANRVSPGLGAELFPQLGELARADDDERRLAIRDAVADERGHLSDELLLARVDHCLMAELPAVYGLGCQHRSVSGPR
jgi:hypothetical protein